MFISFYDAVSRLKISFCSLPQTAEAHSWTCMDLYVFATPYRVTWDYYFSAREHKLEIESWEEPAELEYVCLSYFCVFFWAFLLTTPYKNEILTDH